MRTKRTLTLMGFLLLAATGLSSGVLAVPACTEYSSICAWDCADHGGCASVSYSCQDSCFTYAVEICNDGHTFPAVPCDCVCGGGSPIFRKRPTTPAPVATPGPAPAPASSVASLSCP